MAHTSKCKSVPGAGCICGNSVREEPAPLEQIVGEVARLRHLLAQHRGLVDAFESHLTAGLPTSESAAAVVQSAVTIVAHAARLDVLELARRRKS